MTASRTALFLALCAVAVLLGGAPARAADASDWSRDLQSAVRLIAGGGKAGRPLEAGVEIKLMPGWHTYWRYPGDSGIPPQFDFSGSDNLKSATVLYPAPHLHSDEAGETIVYEDDVVFPVRVVPKDADQPVRLHLKLAYAVCEKVCIPAEASVDLPLTVGESGQDAVLAAAKARVPKPVTAAAAGLSVHRVAGGAKPQVLVDVAGAAPAQIFAEGPTPDWALPIPKPVADAPAGHRQFKFALDGLPPGGDPKQPVDLTFTLTGGDHPLEVKTHLD